MRTVLTVLLILFAPAVTASGHLNHCRKRVRWTPLVRQLGLLRDNQNHARCDNQASLPAVSVLQRKVHPGIMMSGCQAGVNRDRGAPRSATPPTPPGIRVRTTAVRRIKRLPPAPGRATPCLGQRSSP